MRVEEERGNEELGMGSPGGCGRDEMDDMMIDRNCNF
jgi:hypothetical protein